MDLSLEAGVLWRFALLWAVVVPTPGPNQLMVTHVALTAGPRAIGLAIAGNLAGVALWCLCALFGLAVLLSAAPAAQLAVSLAGGAYLAWIGVRLVRGPRAGATDPQGSPPALGGRRAVALGFATALSNAQAVLFITSVFAVSGVVGASLATGFAAVAVLLALNAIYLSGLGWLMQRPAAQAFYARWRRAMERLFGLLFVAFGARLLAGALGSR